MKWRSYSLKFRAAAKKKGYERDEIERCISYAVTLFKQNLPIIYSHTHLSFLLGYKREYLLKASNASYAFYRQFTIPKKSGGVRIIAEPLPSLKEIQRWILNNILYKCPISDFAKAYAPDMSIKDNARFHKKQRKVLTIDIKDFFESIKFPKIYTFFKKLGYSASVSVILGKLCCLSDSLPQGAITSPTLSNLLSLRIDKRISGFAKKNGFRYTRYADDLSFSGDFQTGRVIKFVRKVLDFENLRLNEKKTRLMLRHERQEVTGIIVNEKLQAPRKLRRILRQQIYYINKYGLASHLDKTKTEKGNYIKHLLGLANFISFINPKDESAKSQIETLKKYLK